MITINGKIACCPVDRDFKPELKTTGGFGTMKQTLELIQLTVLLDSESNYLKGDFIYVNGAILDRSPWAKEVLILDGVKLILVPETDVIIVKKGESNDSVHTPQRSNSEGV